MQEAAAAQAQAASQAAQAELDQARAGAQAAQEAAQAQLQQQAEAVEQAQAELGRVRSVLSAVEEAKAELEGKVARAAASLKAADELRDLKCGASAMFDAQWGSGLNAGRGACSMQTTDKQGCLQQWVWSGCRAARVGLH